MTFALDHLNWFAVVVAAIAAFVIGGIWYAAIFGKAWLALHRYTDEDVKAMAKGQGIAFALFFVGYFIQAVVLALLLQNMDIVQGVAAATVGLVVWFGFSMTTDLIQNAAHRKPPAAFAIDTSHQLIVLVTMGLILGYWQ